MTTASSQVRDDPDGANRADPLADEPLRVGGRTFTSRLFLGTGKYPSHAVMRAAHEASGTECVTVAVRRVNLDRREASLLDFVDTSRITLLPNTAGCYTAEDAIRTARLGREAGLSELVKLEVLGDKLTLLPDPIATLEATRQLVKGASPSSPTPATTRSSRSGSRRRERRR